MNVIFQSRIYRADLLANPTALYVFGDNLARVGMGGQAGQMRGEPNAFGFATKIRPGSKPEDFYADDVDEHRWCIAVALQNLGHRLVPLNALPTYTTLVLPLDGLGTGLSQMPTVCPKLYAYMKTGLEHRLRIDLSVWP